MGFATVGEVTDRRTDRHTDTGDFIICPMLCYSNGTDKNEQLYTLYVVTDCQEASFTTPFVVAKGYHLVSSFLISLGCSCI